MFSQLLLTCSVFVSLSFCGDPEGTPSGGSDLFVSQYYKEHQIRTEQLCPDLQESPAGRDIDTANYPYKSVFKLADQVWRTADPCVFDTPSRGPRNQFTTLVIKAIQGENQPWNYSGAQPCPEHIKLRIPSRRIFSRTGMPLCTVPKPPNPAKLFQGPYYNPHVWQLTRQKMGLSFALYENETIGQMKDDEDGGNEANNEIGAQPNNGFVVTNAAKLPKFVHIVFALLIGETCNLRVQQYIVDPSRRACNASLGRMYALCGMYHCKEEERIMQQAGFGMNGAMHLSEKYKLIDFLRTKQFRHSSETSIVDFFINLMRLLIMPMVFFVAYYVTRQLREKLISRQLPLPSQSTTQPSVHHRGGTIGGGGRVGVSSVVILDSPTSSRRTRLEDPPPPYDSIITPPTYVEATTQKIQIMSPSTSFPPPFSGGITTTTNQTSSVQRTQGDEIVLEQSEIRMAEGLAEVEVPNSQASPTPPPPGEVIIVPVESESNNDNGPEVVDQESDAVHPTHLPPITAPPPTPPPQKTQEFDATLENEITN